MSDTGKSGGAAGAETLARSLERIAEHSRRLLESQSTSGDASGPVQIPDPGVVMRSLVELGNRLAADPARLAAAQLRFFERYARVVDATVRRLKGEDVDPVVRPDPGDKRFKGEEWETNPTFDFIKQTYLLAAQVIQETVHGVDGMDPQTARKGEFYMRQLVDALAPTNFVATNPRVLRETLESGGENLVRGMEQMLGDLERGRGRLRVRMTRTEAFELGRNIATTPGKVVYENAMMQLIQYTPSTESVYRRPLLIIPPWINKFYILDLRDSNSFIGWAVARGHTVFVVSWVNPDASLAHKDFEDYVSEGVLAALEAIAEATGEREVNTIGYCIGGTLLGCTLACMAARGDRRVRSATFFTSLLDFADVGELSVFIDEEQIGLIEREMEKRGFLDGSDMSNVFNLLRPNDLIWSFVVNNYLLGREPMAFDLLYWNSDSTRMPARMHSFYLRNMYLDNRLAEPGGITLLGEPINLGRVTVPAYFLSTREDHIAPWQSTYAGARHLGGPVRFVLGGSGHIAGVINPEGSRKYGYWTNSRRPAAAQAWLGRATAHEGSWWPDWSRWIARFGGGKVPARVPGEGGLAAIEDAPGRYVLVRS